MIRHAMMDDLGAILEMGEEFFKSHPISTTGMPYDYDSTTMYLMDTMEHGMLMVVEKDGDVVGFIGVGISEMPYNTDYKVAQERFFYVHPEHRGIGTKLLKEAEEELKAEGVDIISMVSLQAPGVEKVDAFYRGKGYTPVEHTYAKVL